MSPSRPKTVEAQRNLDSDFDWTSGGDLISNICKIHLPLTGGSLSAPIVKTYDADSRENAEEDVNFAEDLGPGTCSLSLFIHVQCVDQVGTNRIINYSVRSLEAEN